MLNRIDAHVTLNPIRNPIEIFLGDYIDRGPASRDVFDLLVARDRSFRSVFLKGNHERYLTEFLSNPAVLQEWQLWGGLETLMSYGVRPTLNADAETQAQIAAALDQVLPESHRQFLGKLAILVHMWRFLLRACGGSPRRSISQTARRGFTIHPPGFSALRRGLQQDHCPWAYPGRGARDPLEPHQHRYRGLCDWAVELPCIGRRERGFHLTPLPSRPCQNAAAPQVLASLISEQTITAWAQGPYQISG